MNGLTFDFQMQADGVYRSQDAAIARFPIVIERHDRESFQKAGHFIPRMVDEEQRAREWDGPFVFVGIVWWEQKDANGVVTAKLQALRVLADTPQELMRLMDLRIRETFFSWFLTQQLQSTAGTELKRLADENNSLREKLGLKVNQ